jgi:RNA polymerase sigma-70 factor (sigma-E family)
MAENGRDAAFIEYVTAAGPWLRKVAYLLCQDWHRADDLVQSSITRLYVHWNRASRVENLDGYARAILVNVFLAEQRSPWWKRVVVYRAPIESAVFNFDVDTSLDLRDALASVPPRQRATLVLRYFCDLSIEQTASVLDCSPGTVKSQTARGLEAMRRLLEARPVNP